MDLWKLYNPPKEGVDQHLDEHRMHSWVMGYMSQVSKEKSKTWKGKTIKYNNKFGEKKIKTEISKYMYITFHSKQEWIHNRSLYYYGALKVIFVLQVCRTNAVILNLPIGSQNLRKLSYYKREEGLDFLCKREVCFLGLILPSYSEIENPKW